MWVVMSGSSGLYIVFTIPLVMFVASGEYVRRLVFGNNPQFYSFNQLYGYIST